MIKTIAKAVAIALAIWTIVTGLFVLLSYYNLFGFSMGVVIATGAISFPVTIGMYGTLVGFGVLYWLAAYLSDNL